MYVLSTGRYHKPETKTGNIKDRIFWGECRGRVHSLQISGENNKLPIQHIE